ncbi:hypothetical protein B0T16DRAFT_423593 [Cercophora newfieldiana]|uniref:Mid2 domain-containing protein n=1 Tax=Cercophora newfieldiana TaxID=92897 RepID=A0AA39XT10_9PEZI|nr:hypothetical protein B0T16DRAFT_423593 [Cercophora newfieldiana]
MARSRRLFCALRGVLLVAPLLSSAQSNTITCFGFNGGGYTDNILCPGSNACCGSGATCLSNRICVNPNGELVRAPCRVFPFDETCAQICRFDEPSLGGLLPRVEVCPDGSLCCKSDPACCENGLGVFLDESGNVVSSRGTAATTSYPPNPSGTGRITLTPSASTTTTRQTSSSRPTDGLSGPNPTENSTPGQSSASSTATGAGAGSGTGSSGETNNPGENTTGLKIGLGVGIPLAVIATVATVYCILYVKKRKGKAQAAEMMDTSPGGTSYAPAPPAKEGHYGRYSEMGGSGKPGVVAPVELGSSNVTELDGGIGEDRRRYELGG